MAKGIMIKLIVSLAIVSITQTLFGQNFNNLDFENSCQIRSMLCSWEVSWGSEDCCESRHGIRGQHLVIEGKSDNSVGFVEQSVNLPPLKENQLLAITASVMTSNVVGKGAGLNVGMYDSLGNLLSTRDMGGFYSLNWMKGSNQWSSNRITVVCPVGTSTIKIGAILYGFGQAGFDDFEVNFISLEGRKSNQLAKNYITKATQIIAENSLVRDSVDFLHLEDIALKIAGEAKDYRDCYLAIEYMLESLRIFGDHHSFFMSSKEVNKWEDDSSPDAGIDFPKVKVIDQCGYILVPPFHGGNKSMMRAYADTLQYGLKNVFSDSLSGWIVDLRQNTGGNMEPMITGLGPLLDSGKIGSLKDVNGNFEHWYYRNGTYYWEDESLTSVTDPFKIESKLPTAVLTSSQTGSSGEIVAISFVGNTNTKSFGQPTWGLTTGNGDFELPDGAKIFLASTWMIDRKGTQYDLQINPDVEIDRTNEQTEDVVLKSAIKWILSN